MIKIATVEDEQDMQEQLVALLERYKEENNKVFQIARFKDGLDFIDAFQKQYDVVFLDIKMKFLDGMETARKIRQIDKNIIIIFITSLAEFAIQGYDVEAKGFILKPVTYRALSVQLDKVCQMIEGQQEELIVINLPGGIRNIPINDIYYIESRSHYLFIHTKDEVIKFYCTMKEMECRLEEKPFYRCNSGIIVHLKYVKSIANNTLTINNEELCISRSRKKCFMEKLTDYLGEAHYV